MHAHLIITKDTTTFKKVVGEVAKKLNAVVLPTTIQKIDDVKFLKSETKLQSSKNLLFAIENLDTASLEAQNALLKSLEEPSKNTTFVLQIENINSILPTIISRCTLKFLHTTPSKANLIKAKSFINSTKAQKLQKTSKITNKEGAIKFVKNMFDALINDPTKTPKQIRNLEVINETLGDLSRNTNVQLTLTNMVLTIE